MYAIGCDVGSQSLKGILLDPSGRVVAQAAASYDVEYPHAVEGTLTRRGPGAGDHRPAPLTAGRGPGPASRPR